MAYTFGEQSGVLYYNFPASQRPTTDTDRLAFGFSCSQRHATIVGVSSYGRDDVIQVHLASHVTATFLTCIDPLLFLPITLCSG